jgi:selenocysteine lyase/cysteine desulfurase
LTATSHAPPLRAWRWRWRDDSPSPPAPACLPLQYELGGVSHEGCAGLCALPLYLESLACSWRELGRGSGAAGSGGGGAASSYGKLRRETVLAAYEAMAAMEQPLQEQLMGYLAGAPGVTVVGPSGCAGRVPTVSFVHESKASPEIARALQQRGFALRSGHMYAHRLISGLQLRGGAPPEEGVVRVSLLHYNMPEEVQRLIGALEEVL